jgi:hypothetical protein
MWKIKIFYNNNNFYEYKDLEQEINDFISENNIIEFDICTSLAKMGNRDSNAIIILKYKEEKCMKL